MRNMTSLFAVLLLASAHCHADEDYCGEIASKEFEFKYVSWSKTRTALEISVPLRDGKAKFHRLGISVGESAEAVQFDLRMENFKGRAEGTVHLPRPHEIVRVEAIYHQGGCFKLLKATFVNEKRVVEPVDSR